ncbi:MAG: hypothetical protein CVU24_11605 [Betaproteobacteria bacterium HGW-Betaproteobacteria-18]|nr:MAG: hypothetical protein CVU24_11605 [Betaproteobacteria bacterium HGW-Betaproteobacteria-18]
MNIKSILAGVALRVQQISRIFGLTGQSRTQPNVKPSPPSADMPAIRSNFSKTGLRDDIGSVSVIAALKRRRQTLSVPKIELLPLQQRRWLTIKETSARFPCFSEKSLRHLIAQAEAYAKYPKAGLRSNGMIDCIVRPAGLRKIVIDATKFEAWLASGVVAPRNEVPAKGLQQSVGRPS